MKLATWVGDDGSEHFGAVLDSEAVGQAAVVGFSDLAGGGDGGDAPAGRLHTVEAYLRDLDGARRDARALLDGAAPDVLEGAIRPLDGVRLLAPVPRPVAILDCGLTPRHLANSAAVLLRRSLPPVIGPVCATVARGLVRRSATGVRYYKGNCCSVSGHGDTIPWPDFTAFLDIEPELAIVTGALECGADRDAAAGAIAGYTIFNDVSARDVQLAEMLMTGPASCKDLDAGNGLGPWLVTPDELGDPRSLEVSVQTADRAAWWGRTAEYSMDPVDVLLALAERQSLCAGTVVGMGTVPDTCGLDRDEWLEPGEQVAITFEGIGTLEQRLGVPETMPRTRWPRH